MPDDSDQTQFLILRGSEADIKAIKKVAREKNCFSLIYSVDSKTKSYDLQFLNIIASDAIEEGRE